MFKKFFLKYFLIFVFSFFISHFIIKEIFIANSPKIRPNLARYFLAKINNFKDNLMAKLNLGISFDNQQKIAYKQEINEQVMKTLQQSLKPVTKGISAATIPGYSYNIYKINEIEWAQITYTLKNGKNITIEYPKATNPPPKEIFENEN